MERGQFTFYGSFYKAIRRIRKKSARADAYDAICAYALLGIEPEMDALDAGAAIVFDLIKPNLDASKRKAEGRMAKRNGEDTGKILGRQEEEEGKKKENLYKRDIECNTECDTECNTECDTQNECYNPGARRDFETFWSVYPRKVGKQAAWRAFAGVSVPVQTLVEAVNAQRTSEQWTREGGRFTPNPATWLNRCGWEDELPPADIPKGASGVLSEVELENIRRLLQE